MADGSNQLTPSGSTPPLQLKRICSFCGKKEGDGESGQCSANGGPQVPPAQPSTQPSEVSPIYRSWREAEAVIDDALCPEYNPDHEREDREFDDLLWAALHPEECDYPVDEYVEDVSCRDLDFVYDSD